MYDIVKYVFWFSVGLVVVCFIKNQVDYKPTPAEIKASNDQAARYRHEEYDGISKSIAYLKDNRTGLCFAYYWGGMASGGPAIATVPCDKVSNFLEK